MDIFEILLILIGCYYIILALIIKSGDVLTSITLKVIPFFSGVYLVCFSLLNSGIIEIK